MFDSRSTEATYERRLVDRRGFLGGAFALGMGLTIVRPGVSHAEAAALSIADTGDWGARSPAGAIDILDRPARKIIIHHTATPNSTDYSKAHAFDLARSIQNYHMDHNGWIDTGQHFTVSRGGHMMEGRHHSLTSLHSGDQHVRSAHTSGQNALAIGIENEGTYNSVDIREEHYTTLLELCVHICEQYGIDGYEIYGHRDFNATECPGDRLYGLLSNLREDVSARLGGDPAAVSWPLLRRDDTGESVRILQHLLNEHGAGISVDGVYGPATESAVTRLQRTTGAIVDGLAGTQTWNQAIRDRARGATGNAVRAVQLGVSAGVDGIFGPNTEQAVISFQSAKGIRADGIVEARTWSHLV